MSRANAIARAHAYFDDGGFLADLTRRVAIPSSSQEPERANALRSYLVDEIQPTLAPLGFTCRVLDNPLGPPVLVAERMENPDFVTALMYGHGDTIRGFDDLWRSGLAPWRVVVEGDRIYGRGTADNKGQHSINIGALAAVLQERGALGLNCKSLIERAEELGSVGLREVCAQHRDAILKADVLIGSDGPRNAPNEATIFLGARGGYPIDLFVNLREGSHHSGNWGGLLANAGVILAQALATLTHRRGATRAHCQLKYVVGTPVDDIIPALRRHLDRHRFSQVEARLGRGSFFNASRLDPADPWVSWTKQSIARTTGRAPTVLPNFGGSLPNDIFADVLNLKTLWVPHSYSGCSQHAPDEHLLAPIAREGLGIMAGLFWDLGDQNMKRPPHAGAR